MRCSLLALLLLAACFDSSTQQGTTDSASSGEAFEPEPQCDSQTQRSFCDAGELIECDAEGFFEVSSCGPEAQCAEGSDGAGCVWRLGEGCDGEPSPTCWDPGGVLACNEGFWTFEGCGVDERCKQRYGDAACIPAEQADCTYPDFQPRCEGDVLVECGAFDVETTRTCGAGTHCETTLDGAGCIEDGAAPCDPDVFEGQCPDGRLAENCDPNTGWTQRLSCGETEHCLVTPLGAACFPSQTETCDPGQVEPTCTDGVARGCGSFGVTYEQVCAQDERCAIDDSWFFGGERQAACIPLDAEACAEPSDILCEDDALFLCIDGARVGGFPCPSCTEDEDGASCD